MVTTTFTADQLRAAIAWLSPEIYDELAATLVDQNPELTTPTAYQLRIGLNALPEKLCDEVATIVGQSDAAPPMLTVDELRTGLGTLPQELYDEISGLVFDYHGGFREIHEAYKPPWQLQICREIREKFSRSYYGSEEPWWHSSSMHDNGRRRCLVLRRWLGALSQDARGIMAWTSRKGTYCRCAASTREWEIEDVGCSCELACNCWKEWLHRTGRMVFEYHKGDFEVAKQEVEFDRDDGVISTNTNWRL